MTCNFQNLAFSFAREGRVDYLVTMSAKYYNTEHVHPYSFDQVSDHLNPLSYLLSQSYCQVAHAIFQRYPNPFARHVLSEDTVYREVINGTTLYTRRFLTKTNKIPKWGERWLASFRRSVPLLEESWVDTEARTITTYTRNVGLANFMSAIETVVYKVIIIADLLSRNNLSHITRPVRRTLSTPSPSSLPGKRVTSTACGLPSRASGSKGSRSIV